MIGHSIAFVLKDDDIYEINGIKAIYLTIYSLGLPCGLLILKLFLKLVLKLLKLSLARSNRGSIFNNFFAKGQGEWVNYQCTIL